MMDEDKLLDRITVNPKISAELLAGAIVTVDSRKIRVRPPYEKEE
jgi:hypothetical protein